MSAEQEAATAPAGTRSPTRRAARVLGGLVLLAAVLVAGRTLWTALRPRPPVLAADADGAARLPSESPRSLGAHVASVNGLALSSDGLLLASGSDDRSIGLRSIDGGFLRRTLRGPEQPVLGVAFGPDGRRLAAACGEMIWGRPGGVHVFDVETGEAIAGLTEPQSASASVAWSPDGRFLAAGTGCAVGSCETTIHVWDGLTFAHRARLDGHDGAVGGLAFSPDGTRLASASADGSVRLWNPEDGEALSTLPDHDAPVICVAFDGDGTRLASGGGHPLTGVGNEVLVWDLSSGTCRLRLAGHQSTVFGVAFSPDGTRLASVSGAAVPLPGGLRSPDASLRLWDADTGASLAVRPVASETSKTLEGLWAVAFTGDGEHILAAADDGRILVWTLDAAGEPDDGPR